MPFDNRSERDRYRAEAEYLERMRHPNGEPENKRLRGGGDSRDPPDVIPPDDVDMDAGTGTSTPGMAPLARSMGGSSGGRTDGSETAVDPITDVKLRPFRETQNVVMPFYITERDNALTSADSAAGMFKFAIRLNSSYDCLTDVVYSADPTAAADVADAIVQKPMYYKFWAA